MMRWLIVLFMQVTAVYSINSSAKDQITLIIGYQDWPPMQYSKNGEASGSEIEKVSLIFEQAGLQIEYRQYPWKRILHLVKLGHVDVAISAGITPERKEYAYFSERVFSHGHNTLFTLASQVDKFDGKTTLRDVLNSKLHIGVQLGVSYSPDYRVLSLRDDFSRTFVLSENEERSLLLLLNHRIDGFLSAYTSMRHLLVQSGHNEDVVPVFHINNDADARGYLMFSKTSVSPIVVQKVNDAMAKFEPEDVYLSSVQVR